MRSFVKAARTTLTENNMGKELWAEAMNTAVFILNRTGKNRMKDKTPDKVWFQKKMYIMN